VETVLIPGRTVTPGDLAAFDDLPRPSGEDDDKQPFFAQCLSSQVGCAMGCVFCASGLAGFKRHLSASEMVSQVLLGRNTLEGVGRIDGMVLMGMGEPLHNLEAVTRTLALLNHPRGAGLSLRRMVVSTCGLVPEIERLGRQFGGRVPLAVSVHATEDPTRTRLMPINRKYPIRELFGSLRRYALAARRPITIEYTLIRGVNDTSQDASRLAALLRGMNAKVNLIPMNSVPGTDLDAPSESEVERFQHRLRRAGILALVRRRRGNDIAAACGQLALRGDDRQTPTSRSYPEI
jgi:23S rRNA (adenine2503-C2)-methyltransferase